MRDYTTTCKFWSHLTIRIFIQLRCMHFHNAPKLVNVLPVPIINSTVIFPVDCDIYRGYLIFFVVLVSLLSHKFLHLSRCSYGC